MDFLAKPKTDFAAVRDGRNSMPLWLDIDLTAARSIAANTALSINIAGNSFYIDQDTTNVGNATVHFQDTNLGNSSAPLFVSAGFIANVPFTQLLIENTAQAGKRLRIFYGVDIDFQAGINASIAISGSVTVNNPRTAPVIVSEGGNDYSQSWSSTTLLLASAVETIVAPATNINGLLILDYCGSHLTAAYGTFGAVVAKNALPGLPTDGVIVAQDFLLNVPGTLVYKNELRRVFKLPAGLGLYYVNGNQAQSNAALRSCTYKVL